IPMSEAISGSEQQLTQSMCKRSELKQASRLIPDDFFLMTFHTTRNNPINFLLPEFVPHN
ncbi:MAG: hypothetical protein JXR22_08765, partial [Prolixibacteraceae bacterium]|nr:hypothetical protein [Prolixibacteraceae bacterium]